MISAKQSQFCLCFSVVFGGWVFDSGDSHRKRDPLFERQNRFAVISIGERIQGQVFATKDFA
jgi:hypothetical protein